MEKIVPIEDKIVTFHVHLPVDIEKHGQPIVIGNGKELGEWKLPIIKLFRPFPNNNPTYWKSKSIVISNVPHILQLSYNYAIHVPSSIFQLEDEKVLFESSEKRSLDGKNQFDVWINGNDLLKKFHFKSIADYAFVDCIYKQITPDNLSESVEDYIKLLKSHEDLTIGFSNYNYIVKNINDISSRDQRLFLCLLLGFYISREHVTYNLPQNFKSDVLIDAFVDYKKDILCSDDIVNFIIIAISCLIQHNAFQSKLKWIEILTIVNEIDPEFSFLENLKDVKYNDSDLCKIADKIKPYISSIKPENAMKVTRWLVRQCENIKPLFEVWDIFPVRNKQISQYFIYQVQSIISNNHANDLLFNYSKIPCDFQDRVSYTFRKRALSLLKNLDECWTISDVSALRKLLLQDNLNWNHSDIMSFLKLMSRTHNLELSNNFPEFLNDLLSIKSFSDVEMKKISAICKDWFKLLLSIKITSLSDENKYVFMIFQQLDHMYPLFKQRINIWRDLSTIALDKVKGYSESCILGATKSIIEIQEKEVNRLFTQIIKEILNNEIQQADDQLMSKIFLICDCKDKSLEVPHALCEDILCHIMFILRNQLPISERHLSILKSSQFWITILSATGSNANLRSNSLVQQVQTSIVELDRMLLEKTIDMQLLQQILEYSDDMLSQHFKAAIKGDREITTFKPFRKLYLDYKDRIAQLSDFYKEFCSIPQVTDANDFIHDIQKLVQNSNKVTLKQVSGPDYWIFHEKALDSAAHCYRLKRSQTFRNIYEDYLQKNSTVINVEDIAQKFMPSVFKKYDAMCKKFESWEVVSCSEALLSWKNIKNIHDEFKLTELSPYKNSSLLHALEILVNLPQWTERIEQLKKIFQIFSIQLQSNDILKYDSLVLGQLNQFVKDLESKHYHKVDQNCWNLIKELSIAEDFLNFLKIIPDQDIKKLINDHSDEMLIQEDTVLSLIHVKKNIFPLINNPKVTADEFLDELQLIVKKNSTLACKLAWCISNNAILQEMHCNILNHEQDTIEKIKNASFNGTYSFAFDEKNDKCLVTLNHSSSTIDINEIPNLRDKALLLTKSDSFDKNTLIELPDFVQIVNLVTSLMQRGHLNYRKFEKKIEDIESAKKFLTELYNDLEKWEDTLTQAQKRCYYLTFFTGYQIFSFYDYFTSEQLDEKNAEMCQTLIRFVNSNAQLPSHGNVKISCESDPLEILCEIGYELDIIFRNVSKSARKLEVIRQEEISSGKLFVVNYKDRLLIPNAIMSLYSKNGYYPEPWQILSCTSSTTADELKMFINRSFLAVDNGYKMQLEESDEKFSLALLCCQELEMPNYILDQYSLRIKKIDMLSVEIMQEIYQEFCPNILCVSSDLSGQGKTEWIKESSFSKQKLPHLFLINDGMDLRCLVNKLEECKLKCVESLHINILSVDHPEDVNQFLFELLTFRMVSYHKMTVSIPETFIYIEISSSIKQQLLNCLSVLRFLPFEHLSWNIENFKVSQETTSPIQIVCHYLSLYDGEIDVKEVTFNILKAVPHPLSTDLCQNLIMKYFLNTNDKSVLSFRYLEIFVNVLADQLIRLSSCQYFMIDNLKLTTKEDNIRSTILKSLIQVSKDFAIKSIKIKAAQLEPITAEDESSYSVRIDQWDDLNYLTIFPNQTSDFCYVLYNDKTKIPDNIKLLLKGQAIGNPKNWKIDDYDKMSASSLLMKLEGMARTSTQKLNPSEYILTSDNLIKMALILLRVRVNIPIVICGEAGCGKTSLITYLAKSTEVQFQALNLHAGIDEETITRFMSDALSKAKEGEVWILFDEINTCSCLGILADLISNRMFQGRPIHPNIRLFSTCNPYRLSARATDKKYEEQSNLVYQVKPLPDQILDYAWDYSILNPRDEYEYIQIMVEKELKKSSDSIFSELIYASQTFIRKVKEPYSVSLRDVKRVIKLANFFYDSLEKSSGFGRRFPSGSPTIRIRSYVLALGLCYHSRLYEHELRKKYCYEMGQIFQTHDIKVGEEIFIKIIREEQEYYFSRMRCPPNVAKIEVLLENILVLIVCILTKIPVFVIGETGLSKSLAVRLISSNLRGPESSDDYFKTLPKCILVMDEKKLTSANQSLLNRFEKQRLTIGDVLIDRQQSLVRQLKSWTRRLSTFKDDSSIRLHDRSTQKNLFIGIDDDENLQSLVLDLTKYCPDADDKNILEKCKKRLTAVITSDGIVRAEQSALTPEEIKMLRFYYFQQQLQLEGSIDHDKLEQSLFIQAINFLLQKISDEEEYEQDLDIILSLVERMNDTTNMTNLPLLLNLLHQKSLNWFLIT
ncbi:14093_t:CDS:2 [Funneliformis geosporum]|uniref:14093_t:CDS:1 n=1 Tax=Funneliformis geosporum TaxID=1117311 RepID=A0A9W4WY71_9GLOM|nr:14093_t:CDS:2 [Funneliformis geosporum]